MLTDRIKHAWSILFEKARGIDIISCNSIDELGLNPKRSERYSSTSNVHLANVLKSFDITSVDSIIDFGSGKGGALFTMARFPFKEILGVELSEKLHQIALNNKRKLRAQRVKLFQKDAAAFKEIDGCNYFYFYNPFPSQVMKEVIKNISVSLSKNPRNITLIYMNPVCHKVMTDSKIFRKTNEFPGDFGNKIFIYTNSIL